MKPDFPGVDMAITSNEAFYLPQLPKRVVIVGGGYIAVEFAGIFNGYGSDVHIVLRKDTVLRGFDEDCRHFLQKEMLEHGITIHTGSEIDSVVAAGDNGGGGDGGDGNAIMDVQLSNGELLEGVGTVMCATGRAPKTDGLGLDAAGVDVLGNGAIKVDEWQQTSVPSIYAIGDCTDTLQLTPAALAEGHCFADTHYGPGDDRQANLEHVATAVFSQPNLGTVGLTEVEARQLPDGVGDAVRIFRSEFRPMKHTISGSTERNLCKVIVCGKTDRVLGMHMVGHGAGEIMQGFAVGMKMGMTKAQLDSTIGIHPTTAEEFVTLRTESFD